MQNLVTTPLCAIRGEIVKNHKKYFQQAIDCPTCKHIEEVCTCKFEARMQAD